MKIQIEVPALPDLTPLVEATAQSLAMLGVVLGILVVCGLTANAIEWGLKHFKA